MRRIAVIATIVIVVFSVGIALFALWQRSIAVPEERPPYRVKPTVFDTVSIAPSVTNPTVAEPSLNQELEEDLGGDYDQSYGEPKEEHHMKQFDENHPLLSAEWSLLTILPDITPESRKVEKKGNGIVRYSPNGDMQLLQTDDTLQVRTAQTDNVVMNIELGDGIKEFNAVWLYDGVVMLTEKDATARAVDRIYLVNAYTGDQWYVNGSFPAAARFNLNNDPQVYGGGRDIVYEDNDGEYWLLRMEYRE